MYGWLPIIFQSQTGVEAVHIASVLGDCGTVFAFNVQKHLLPVLNDKIVTLGLRSILYGCAKSHCMGS